MAWHLYHLQRYDSDGQVLEDRYVSAADYESDPAGVTVEVAYSDPGELGSEFTHPADATEKGTA